MVPDDVEVHELLLVSSCVCEAVYSKMYVCVSDYYQRRLLFWYPLWLSSLPVVASAWRGQVVKKEGASGDMSDSNVNLKFAFHAFALNQDGRHFMADILTKTYILYYICTPVFIAYCVLQLQA